MFRSLTVGRPRPWDPSLGSYLYIEGTWVSPPRLRRGAVAPQAWLWCQLRPEVGSVPSWLRCVQEPRIK